MTGLWRADGDGWREVQPTGFPLERDLQDQVAKAPEMLPLAGAPDLAGLGSEVILDAGRADVFGIETGGRPVIMEVKLGGNPEAKRSVVTQILTYAASLHGMTLERLEQSVLVRHLQHRGVTSLFEAAATADDTSSLERTRFEEAVRTNLAAGSFRLVLVLDEAPAELLPLVAYLEKVTDGLVIDLVNVAAYEVGGTKLLAPQRLDPARPAVSELVMTTSATSDVRRASLGTEAFEDSCAGVTGEARTHFDRLIRWAKTLESEGLTRLQSFDGKGRSTLLVRRQDGSGGLATIWNEGGSASLQIWKAKIEDLAPNAYPGVAAAVDLTDVVTWTTVAAPNDALLDAMTEAYREAFGP